MLPPKKEARILRQFCEAIGRHDDTAFTYHELLGLLYGLALHVAYARRFRGRTAAGLSVAGFVLLVGVLVASMLLPKA